MKTSPAISVQRLGKSFAKHTALEQVHFDVPTRHICALLGPNGAGKTTLLRCMTGAVHPSFGRCLLAGHDTSRDTKATQHFAFLPDLAPLEDELRVQEYLLLHARLRMVPAPHALRVQEALSTVELTEQQSALIGTLSRGQRSRLALAECLLHRPSVLLLDEPSAGLDPAQTRSLRQMLERLKSRACILIASHNLPEVASVCDSVVVLVKGRVRFQGSIAELAAQGDSLEDAYLRLAGEIA